MNIDLFFQRIEEILDEEIYRKILKSGEGYNNGRVRKAEDVFKE